jgi:serine/threonine-protein kinase
MITCPQCSGDVADANRFCPDCGSSLDVSSNPTSTALGRTPPPPRPPSSGASGVRSASSLSAAQVRFVPGAILAGRYRILGLLGRGGMGEVYRADDLRLGQPVALKFLPEALQHDPERLERFFNGVRMARQVTHPAICRVHDVGEADGQQFLSMEFVDGEDLASLQRRIGRLPPDKVLQIARQLCAGLAAAHEKGVLHRDLKPENVMLDGRGMARITDFDLAASAETVGRDDVRSGTPAYMSPEQLAGREVTARSDIYALGLMLYELFTGRRPFAGRTFPELLRARQELPPSPSSFVETIDPAVEQAIMRCLEPEPARRPASVVAVAAALPGGDPLAAALAAGQTPSPELVAASGRSEGLAAAPAWLALAAIAIAIVVVPMLRQRFELFRLAPFDKPPAALEDRARDLLTRMGHTERAADRAVGFAVDAEYIQQVEATDRSPHRWDSLAIGEPPVLLFWYRQSPRPLVSTSVFGRVSSQNPPLMVSGMAGVRLDMRGRLVEFYSIPPQVADASAAALPDWRPLFAEAGLEPGRLQARSPQWTPPFFCDSRAAWEGSYAQRPDVPIRVEAAGYGGRVVYFIIVAPWTRPERMRTFQFRPAQQASNTIGILLALSSVIAAAALARRNMRLGRGDRRGALRLASYGFVAAVVFWALQADHVAELRSEVGLILDGLAICLLVAAMIWLLYLALEPSARRRWPSSLVSWTRVLSGRLADPLVGRDLLVGAAAGAVVAVLVPLSLIGSARLGQPALRPSWDALDTMLGLRMLVSYAIGAQLQSAAAGMLFFFLLLVLRLLLHREWLAVAALVALSSIQPALALQAAWWLVVLVEAVALVIVLVVLVRFGLLAVIALEYVLALLNLPLTTDLRSWSAGPTFFVSALILAIAVHAFRTALAGRPALAPITD